MIENNYRTIGNAIRTERKKRGWSQEDLISEMAERKNGIGRSSLSKLENGEMSEIKFSHILTLCNIFDCDIGFLLGNYAEKTKELSTCSEYTGLSEDTLKSLHSYKDESFFTLISSFFDYFLDYQSLIPLLISFEQYIQPQITDGYICDSSGKTIGVFTDDLKYLMIQQAFKDFLSFASERKNGKNPFSKSKEREDYEKYTSEQKRALANEYIRMIEEGK